MSDEELIALGWGLENLHGPVAAEVFRRTAASPDGEYSLTRMLALFHLNFRGPQTISQLAWAVPLSHAAASRMVDGLVRAGLVDRREGETDRRQKSVTITPSGQQQVRRFRALTAEIYAERIATLTVDERLMLKTVLDAALSGPPNMLRATADEES